MHHQRIEIPIAPIPKGRPRIGKGAGGRPVAFTPSRTRAAEADVLALVSPHAPAEPLLGPIELDIVFSLPIPRSWPAWRREAAALGIVYPIGRPDLDNLEKLLEDALTRAGFWRDDSQIIGVRTRKRYGLRAFSEVWITELEQPTTAAEWKASR